MERTTPNIYDKVHCIELCVYIWWCVSYKLSRFLFYQFHSALWWKWTFWLRCSFRCDTDQWPYKAKQLVTIFIFLSSTEERYVWSNRLISCIHWWCKKNLAIQLNIHLPVCIKADNSADTLYTRYTYVYSYHLLITKTSKRDLKISLTHFLETLCSKISQKLLMFHVKF